jgi:hypothetical protein
MMVGTFYLFSSFSQKDRGTPWNNTPQKIPGKIQCEFYNLGGEGIAYHDTDSINEGSGMLNPANGTFLNEFRMNESVDISYTKGNNIDNNEFGMMIPEMNQLYVGWTKPSEWINYTVTIKKTGRYIVGIQCSNSGDGAISLSLNNQDISGNLYIPTTRNDKDPIAWRKWHHWNYADSITTVNLPKGTHVLTLHTRVEGEMGLDFLDFKLTK